MITHKYAQWRREAPAARAHCKVHSLNLHRPWSCSNKNKTQCRAVPLRSRIYKLHASHLGSFIWNPPPVPFLSLEAPSHPPPHWKANRKNEQISRPRVPELFRARLSSVRCVRTRLQRGKVSQSTCSAAAARRTADSALMRSTLSCSWSTSFSTLVLFRRLTIGFSRFAIWTGTGDQRNNLDEKRRYDTSFDLGIFLSELRQM